MSKKVKAILAGVLFVFAVLVILWLNTDLFTKAPPPPPDPMAKYTPEEKQQIQKETQQRIEWEKKQKPPSGS